MSTVSEQLGERAKEVTEDLRIIGEAVTDTAQETLGQLSDRASECCEQSRDKVHGIACACEQFVSERPLRSVLVAAGIGWLVGRLWKPVDRS